jgi:hypothetical protein
MSSVPNRPMSTASSAASITSNQSASNPNKKQQVKQNKPAATGGKASSDAGSISDITEIS